MKYLNHIFVWVLFFLWGACAEDKGNYDYHEVNKPDISGIDSDNWYKCITHVDTLRIYPEVKNMTSEDVEGGYEYEWKLIPESAETEEGNDTLDYVIAKTKNLEYPVVEKEGRYIGYFHVKDLETGVVWTQKFFVQLSSLMSEGWMVLCKEGESSRLDMIVNVDEHTDIVSHDLWGTNEFEPGKPIKLFYNFSESSDGGPRIVFVCEKGTYMLDRTDLHAGEDNNIRWNFGARPEQVNVRGNGVSLHSYLVTEDKPDGAWWDLYWVIVDDQGDVYVAKTSGGNLFDLPCNQINGKPFKAAPFVGNGFKHNQDNNLGAVSTVLYDEAGCFLEVKSGASRPSVMKFSGNTLFAAEQPGKKMVMLQSTNGDGMVYAVLQDGNGDYYYYGIRLGSLGVNTQEYYGKISGPDLNEAKYFACHPTLGILFYATKDRVYRLDMKGEEEAVEMLHFPGETIRVLKFNPLNAGVQYSVWESMRSEQLVVGTVNDEQLQEDENTCGIMRTYEIPTWDAPIKKKEHTGIGNLIDITYKETRR